MTASSISVSHSGREARPGLRTFRSRRFRALVGALLLAIGVAVLGSAMVRQAADPAGQFAIDFTDYHLAAERMAAGASPYAPEMLQGPVDAQGTDRYRYPPLLAQLLVPIASRPVGAAATLWLVLQAAAIGAAAWLAGTAGGSARTPERVLWTAVAATWSLPVFDALWKGNVSGFVALGVALVAMGGAATGVGGAGATLLKVVPVTLLPAIAANGRRALLATVAMLGVLAGGSVLLAPAAWADYAVVLPNLLAGGADHATNLAPATVAARSGLPETGVAVVRLASLAGAGVAVALSVIAARRPGGLPAAATLGAAAMLLLPAALWYHYLVVLLPIAALAWHRAADGQRTAIVGGMGLVSVALMWLPLALAGTAIVIATSLRVTWPSRG